MKGCGLKYSKWIMVLAFANAMATDFVWDNASGGDWDTATNWDLDSGFPNDPTDEATIDIDTSSDVTVTATRAIRQLHIDNSGGTTLSGAGQLNISLDNSHTPQINITNSNGNGAHTISVSGIEVQDINRDFSITNGSTGKLTLASSIISSGASGFANLVFEGPGPIEITGSNSYVLRSGGAVFIGNSTGQTVEMNSSGTALPASFPNRFVFLLNDSTLRWLQSDQLSSDANLQISGSGGSIELNGFDQTVELLFIGTESGSGTLSQISTGAGTLRMKDFNMDGGTNIIASTLTGNYSFFQGTPTLEAKGGSNSVSLTMENINCERPNMDIEITDCPFTINGILSSTTTTNFTVTGQTVPSIDILNLTGSVANTYSGTFTPVDITLNLNKSGVTAITGDLTLATPSTSTTVNVLQSGQFGGSSATGTVSMQDANVTFDISATVSGETVGALDYRAGTLTQGGMTLSLASTGTNALIMRDVTISDPISIISASGGGVRFDDTNDGTALISGGFDLGTIVRDFDVDDGAASTDMRITSVISGTGGGINLTGAGTLELMGSASNTFTGSVTVGTGTLTLDNSSGTVIPGELVISGGTVTTPNSSQTLGSLNFQSGTLTQSGNALNLDSTGTNALTMRGVTISDGINLTGASGGGVFYDSNSGSSTTATISGDLDIGSVTRPFNIESGASTTDMEISGVISGTGGITKSGAGLLELNGSATNNYSGTTTVSAGTLVLNMSSGNAMSSTSVSVTGGTLELQDSDQLPDGATLSVSNSSILQLGELPIGSGVTDTINTLTLDTAFVRGGASSDSELTFSSSNFSNTNTFGLAASVGGTTKLIGPLSGTGIMATTALSTLKLEGSVDSTYTGTMTVDSGATLRFEKDPGVTASLGPIESTGGSILVNVNDDQILTTSSITLDGTGARLVSASNHPFIAGSLIMTEGDLQFTPATVALTLNSTGTNAFVVTGLSTFTTGAQINLTGASGGGVQYDNSKGGIAAVSADLDLGSVQRVFDIQQAGATPDFDMTGVLSGTNGLIKSGLGTLQLNPTSPPNTYTGTIDVQQGELLVDGNGTGGTIRGDVEITGGMVTLGSSDNFVSTSNVTLSSGMFDMASFDETVNSFTFQGGSFVQNMGELSLGSTGTALTMRNTTINGQINLTGASGGDVVFDNTNNGTASIAAIDLGTENRTFNISNGTAANDMILNGGSSTGGGINKAGLGNLRLNGIHAYTGPTTITAGQLQIEGTFSGPTLNVSPGATLLGSGTITSTCTFDGTMAPGSSIGTTFVVGSATFISTSTFEVEHDLTTSDLLDVSGAPGTVTIDPGATLSVITTPAVYPQSSMYTIITSTGGITGNFTNITGTGAAFTYSAAVSGNNLILTVTREPLDVIVVGGNASKVAKCLNELTLEQDSDLQNILVTLECECAVPEIRSLLTQMQPSQLKGFAISQENNSFKIKNAINQRTREIYRKGCAPEPLKTGKISMWGDVFGDFYQQKKIDSEVAFSSNTAGALAGVDYQGVENYLIGFSGSYTYSDMKWKENRGTGDINSVYGTLYGTYFGDNYFINAALLGAFNHYNESRYIKVSFLNRKAQGNFDGGEVMTHLDGAYILKRWEFEFQPFASLDFVYLYQQSFKETGAAGINLDVDSSDYGMFRSELGINVSRCINKAKAQFLIDGKLSWIREERFFGANYEAKFKGTDCTFKVKGMNPDRSLFSPGIRGTYITDNGNKLVSLGYEAEVGGHSLDQNVSLQGIYKF